MRRKERYKRRTERKNFMIRKHYAKKQEELIKDLTKKSAIVEAWYHNTNLLLEYLLDENCGSFNPRKALKIINARDSHQYMIFPNWLKENSVNEIKKALQDCYDVEQEKDFLQSNTGRQVINLSE